MPIISGTPGMMTCPKCGTTGPHNFRLEQRVTLKQPEPVKFPAIVNVTGTISVYACVSCGHVVRELP